MLRHLRLQRARQARISNRVVLRELSSNMQEKLPDRVDVVIVGGGVIGCSSAYHLAKVKSKSQVSIRFLTAILTASCISPWCIVTAGWQVSAATRAAQAHIRHNLARRWADWQCTHNVR
jgi:glycine/D-amino acid oxidase-like deaminating enzyme